MTSRLLESIPGDLLAYKQLEPDSMLHGYEITTERRTCTDEKVRAELRNNAIYTADGQLYTEQKKKMLWGITKLSQNLVLRNVDEAYRQLTQNRNYFPLTEEAEASFRHADTVVVDLEGLKLVKDNDESGHFDINPRQVKRLNSQQKKAAMRLFGPDEDSFGLNMEMLASAEKSPFVFVLMPGYVQRTLKANDKHYLGRASWLEYFDGYSIFDAGDRDVGNRNRVSGVCRASEASQREQESPAGRAPEIVGVPSTPPAASEVKKPTLEEVLRYANPFVADVSKPQFEEGLRKLYKP